MAKRQTKSEIVMVRLEPALLARLKAVQVKVGVPVAEQIRRAVQAWLPQHEGKKR